MPRLITSTPARRFSSILRSSSANRYGGTASRRRANLTAPPPDDTCRGSRAQTDARAKLARPEVGIASDASEPKLLGELHSADLLRRARQLCVAVLELDAQVAAREVHRDRALAPAVRDRRRARSDRARPGGERLPRPPFPHADRQLVLIVHAHQLDVRALREARVMLDQRAETEQFGAIRQALDHGMRVPDRDRGELDVLAVDLDRLRLPDVDRAHLLLDVALAAEPREHHARADEEPNLVGAAPSRKPARRDPRAVPGELGDGAVRVPDDHLGSVVVRRDHLEDAVGADAEVVVADALHPLRCQGDRELGLLDEQVVVAEAVPLGELHRAAVTLSEGPTGRRTTNAAAAFAGRPFRSGWRRSPAPPRPGGGRRRRSRGPGSGASTCAGTRRTGACERRGPRSPPRAAALRCPGGRESSSRSRRSAPRAPWRPPPPPRARTSRAFVPRSAVRARPGAPRARRCASGGVSRRSTGCPSPAAGSNRPRRARARARRGGGRSDEPRRPSPGRARRAARGLARRRPRRRAARDAHARPAAVA